jgi:hypothetical protein
MERATRMMSAWLGGLAEFGAMHAADWGKYMEILSILYLLWAGSVPPSVVVTLAPGVILIPVGV